MGENRIIVDHLKLEYNGPVEFNQLIRTIEIHFAEKFFEKRSDRTYEINTPKGKYIEWTQGAWYKPSDWYRLTIKVRIQAFDLVKIQVAVNGKKKKVDHGRLIIYFDSHLEADYEHRWDEQPLLVFFRSIKELFIEKAYTQTFERILTHDTLQVYELVQQFLNMQHRYQVISKIPHFSPHG